MSTLLVLGTLVFTFMSLELSFRYLGRLQKIQVNKKISSGWAWSESPMRYLQDKKSAIHQINQLGIRGRSIEYDEEDFVVVLMGDSQVEAPGNNFFEMPEALLQKALAQQMHKKVKVFSLASSGWGQDQQLLALEKYFLHYRADLVLEWITPSNDLWENTMPVRSTTLRGDKIKPTFLLKDKELKGPFLYEEPFYLMNSAVVQFFAQITYSLSAEQIIFNRWLKKLPNLIDLIPDSRMCKGNIEISQVEFFKQIYTLDPQLRYTIISDEDFLGGMGHFSPFLIQSIDLRKYQVAITAALFSKIKSTAQAHQAKFRVIYPIQDSLDSRVKSLNCIRNREGFPYPLNLDYLKTIKEIIPSSDLILLPLTGENENVISENDRHLNLIGNAKFMNSVAKYLLQHQIIKN